MELDRILGKQVELILQTGTFESTLDDKGRVVIPAPIRERYTEKLIVMQGKEQCVWVMTPQAFDHFIATFRKESIENKWSSDEIEAFEYQHVSTASQVYVDAKTGRIPIPAILRTYACLTKDCLVVSIKGHLEIWNADLNRSFMEEVRLINKNTHKKMQGKINFFPDEGVL